MNDAGANTEHPAGELAALFNGPAFDAELASGGVPLTLFRRVPA